MHVLDLFNDKERKFLNGGPLDEADGKQRMSRAAKGHEKYGKEGMAALAKAGREGAGEEKLDKIRDKHDKYNEGVAGPKDCWPGHRKVGTQPGTGRNAGKRVNDCEKIGEEHANEGQLGNPGEPDSPVAQAIVRRILMQRTDLLAKHGPDKVSAAVDEVADFVGDVDEIGSSDVSGWVRHVEQMLGNMDQGVAEGSEDLELYGLRVGDSVKAVVNGKRVQGDVIDIFPETMEVELLLRGANAGKTVTVDVRDTEALSEQGVAEGVDDYAHIYSPEAIALGKRFVDQYSITDNNEIQLAVEIIDINLDYFKQTNTPVDLKKIKSDVASAIRHTRRGRASGPRFYKKFTEQGVAEGVAETLPFDDAVKVLRQYGAGHFKTTSNELHFYKNGRPFSVDLIMNPDATRSVSLSQLNSAGRKLKGQGIDEATGDKPFDDMMKTIKKGTAKQATTDRREQRKQSQQQARDAFGPNPAANLGIRKPPVSEGDTEQKPRIRKYTKMRPDGSRAARYEVLDYMGRRAEGQGTEGFDDLKNAKQFYYRNRINLVAPVDESEYKGPNKPAGINRSTAGRAIAKKRSRTTSSAGPWATPITSPTLNHDDHNRYDDEENMPDDEWYRYNDEENLPFDDYDDTKPIGMKESSRYWCKEEKRWKDNK